ncbi:TPA: YhcH/YjgK/YiaL family protein [Escherichia coli]|nr:YhcH/YjgK/YiaL family protein [Escherichia coli]
MIVTSLKTWSTQAAAYHPVIRQALTFLAEQDFLDFTPGKIDLIPDQIFCLLQEMDTVLFSDARPESHRRFIDIQYLISGHEHMGVSRVENRLNVVVDDRTPQQDIMFWQVEDAETLITLTPGMFAIFFPDDIHRPCCHLQDGEVSHLRKAVIKIDSALLEISS